MFVYFLKFFEPFWTCLNLLEWGRRTWIWNWVNLKFTRFENWKELGSKFPHVLCFKSIVNKKQKGRFLQDRIDIGTNLDIIDCLGGSVVQCIRSWTSLDMDGRLNYWELRHIKRFQKYFSQDWDRYITWKIESSEVGLVKWVK